MIGKNALQNTGTKVIKNSNLAEFMKPGLNPISNAYYDVVNFVMDPKTIAYGATGVEILDGYYGGSSPDYKNIGSWLMGINSFLDFMENK
jgi:hypothetical protein